MSGKRASSGVTDAAVADSWKPVIQEYVKRLNRAELERRPDAIAEWLGNAAHAERAYRRLTRAAERDKRRGAVAASHETSARLVRLAQTENGAEAVLRLHLKRSFEQRGVSYVEERIETEKLLLAETGGGRSVRRVEPLVAERRPQDAIPVGEDGELEPDGMEPALRAAAGERRTSGSLARPYINYDLMPHFNPYRQGVPYRRDLAAAYADRWWNEGNPAYETFDVNCTNYVSQCLFAGHAPMNYTGSRSSGWWYKGRSDGREWWSYSWSVSNALERYLSAPREDGLRATPIASPAQLRLGDVIAYDWDGTGRYQHCTIVTAFDREGMPLVNANTTASRHRYWDYRDSYAWTERTEYRFFHIADEL